MKRSSRNASIQRADRAVSWMALVAAATLGIEGADSVFAEVRADARVASSVEGAQRLVVQTYDKPPSVGGRPIGSAQRSVTPDELQRGVRVELVELRGHEEPTDTDGRIVVAWLEPTSEELEFDGRRARPGASLVTGIARADGGDGLVQVALRARGVG